MTHAQRKSPPWQAAGIKTEESPKPIGQGQATAAPVVGALRECPTVAPELFAVRAKAIMTARTRRELHNAIARYAFAAMWARHQTGRGMDLAREVVIHDVQRYASFSAVRPRLRKRFIAHVVARMDEAARCAVEGVDA